jgi:hypothetical protein
MSLAPFVVLSALHVCVRDPRIASGSTRHFLHNLLPLAALLSVLPVPVTPSQTAYTCARRRALSLVQPPVPPTTSSSFFSSALNSSQSLTITGHTCHFIHLGLAAPAHTSATHFTPTRYFFPSHLPPTRSPPVCSEFGQLKHGDIGELAQADQRLTRGRETAKETHSARNRGANIAGTVGRKRSSGEAVCQSDRLARAQIQ